MFKENKIKVIFAKTFRVLCYIPLRVTVRNTPGWLLKSRMRWWDCRRSGFDDERFPLTGRAGGICLDCFIPTMLSSCDWPTQTSLWKQKGECRRGETAVLSTRGRGQCSCWQELVGVDTSGCIEYGVYPQFTAISGWLVLWQVPGARSLQEQSGWLTYFPKNYR